MRHKTIKLAFAHTDHYLEELVKNNQHASDEDFDTELLITENTTVLKPDGTVLLKLIPRAIALDYVTAAFQAFADVNLHDSSDSLRPAVKHSANPGSEGVLGFIEGIHRNNFCRATQFTYTHLKEFETSLPFVRSASEQFKRHMPDRFAAQLEACEKSHPDYIIPGTNFSTVTINRDTTVAYHTDKGDLHEGMGVIAATWAVVGADGWVVVTDNPYSGGLIVFPKYRVAVRVQAGDVLLCDVHEVHGVTPISAPVGTWARMSFVFYFREKIVGCAGLEEEAESLSRKDTKKYRKHATNADEVDEGQD